MLYSLTYAGTPFLIDEAKVFRTPFPVSEKEQDSECLHAPKKHQPLTDLIDEINRLTPLQFIDDFHISSRPSKNLLGIASKNYLGKFPNPDIPIGTWYYPSGASKWSVFRGLASSSQVKNMLAITGGINSALFSMKCVPSFASDSSIYSLNSQMYMLPPRCLGEHGDKFDGLYLITLVDYRYYFQGTPVSLHVERDTTWDDLISQLEDALDISISYSSIPEAYSAPELDSVIWSNWENANTLLDAIAGNLGSVFVRNLDGTYALLTPDESHVIALNNRGINSQVLRTAGGDIFSSGTTLKVGDLTQSKNSILPGTLNISFPKYIIDDDPVPHFMNPRAGPVGRTSWEEGSYGDAYLVSVPITSGGLLVSGLAGTFDETIHDTAKAFYSGEIQASGVPLNASGLVSLSMQIAEDFYNQRAGGFLDETYPGTANWQPEGLHDIIWKWSAKDKQASTRIIRNAYTAIVSEMQHRASSFSGLSDPGIGGKSVAQVWRDTSNLSGTVISATVQTLSANDSNVTISTPGYFPTYNRWRALVDNEVMLMEGTSGGSTVGIVYRGIDGTLAAPHNSGSTLSQFQPNTSYQVNLVTHEKGQFVFPSEWSSGGIVGVNIVPQTRTVRSITGSGTLINGAYIYSARTLDYDPSKSSPWTDDIGVFITPRNSGGIVSGGYYDGQLVGYAPNLIGTASFPLYVVGDAGTAGTDNSSGAVTMITINSRVSGNDYYQGQVTTWNVLTGWVAAGASVLAVPANGEELIITKRYLTKRTAETAGVSGYLTSGSPVYEVQEAEENLRGYSYTSGNTSGTLVASGIKDIKFDSTNAFSLTSTSGTLFVSILPAGSTNGIIVSGPQSFGVGTKYLGNYRPDALYLWIDPHVSGEIFNGANFPATYLDVPGILLCAKNQFPAGISWGTDGFPRMFRSDGTNTLNLEFFDAGILQLVRRGNDGTINTASGSRPNFTTEVISANVIQATVFSLSGGSQGSTGTVLPSAAAVGGLITGLGTKCGAVSDATGAGDVVAQLNALLASLRAGNVLAT